MYIYDDYDQQMLDERVQQFRSQTERYLKGELSGSEFLPLRLQNGLYVQRLAPMLRVAVPYGLLSSKQLRMVARLSRDFDKGYVHISTRQNIQFNWPQLPEVPDILAGLAKVQMHCIQSSGNCIRNTTSDQFAGVAPDETTDPRPYAELIRQWSTFHPEFAFLPRKFKIAVCGSKTDRSAIRVNDIGVDLVRDADNRIGYRIFVGGGLGRTPVVGTLIRDFLEEKHLLTYLEAILRVYNQLGRRDHKFKARIKILVRALGADVFKQKVEETWQLSKDGPATLTDAEIERVKGFFTPPDYESLDDEQCNRQLEELKAQNTGFRNWMTRNVSKHKMPGYSCITLSLKVTGIPPGNITDKQLEAIADIADQYSFGQARTTHLQNMVLTDVKKPDLFELWEKLEKLRLATPNIGSINDIVCCPGGDYCSLANAKSIPVAEEIQRKFEDLDYLYDLGDIDLNFSGCMNACSHHHIGHIGILGVDKKGQEFYQISLGGDSGMDTAIGKILGPSFSRAEIPEVIDTLINTYVDLQHEGERFIDTYNRIGIAPFKERVYDKAH